MTLLNSYEAIDSRNHLHPFTDARAHEQLGPMVINRGSGIYVFDSRGNRFIEGLAGLWSVALGFGEERLIAAATEQLRKLPYYHAFAHKSNEPAILLAEKLVSIAPGNMSKVFFTNSGSEANDTAIKMIWYYNNARGQAQKKKIISRLHAYHGSTIGAGSLTGIPRNHLDFDLPIANILHTSCPHHYRFAEPGESEEAFSIRLAEELEQMILLEGPDTVAAFVGEPVMGAGGVIVPPLGYWERVQQICRKYDILIVADEVICGFGRTGRMFGSELFKISPDIVVVSKQLTSSYLPLAAVLISDQIFQVVADNSARRGLFAHGFTGTGHPVATAVGLENLRIIEERGLVSHAASVGRFLQDRLRGLSDHPIVGEVRGVGLIAAVEIVADKMEKSPFSPVGFAGAVMFRVAHDHGLIIRNIGDTIALCPPLIITELEVEDLVQRLTAALADTHKCLLAHQASI
jgi:4-aminobutyrate---pyruvate transaminase